MCSFALFRMLLNSKSEWSDLFGWASETVCCIRCMQDKKSTRIHNITSNKTYVLASRKHCYLLLFFFSFLFYFFHSLLVFSSSTEMGIFRCMFRMYTVIVVLVRPVFMRSLCRDLPVCCVIVSVLVYNMNPTSTETKNFRLILLCVFSSASSIHS